MGNGKPTRRKLSGEARTSAVSVRDYPVFYRRRAPIRRANDTSSRPRQMDAGGKRCASGRTIAGLRAAAELSAEKTLCSYCRTSSVLPVQRKFSAV